MNTPKPHLIPGDTEEQRTKRHHDAEVGILKMRIALLRRTLRKVDELVLSHGPGNIVLDAAKPGETLGVHVRRVIKDTK